MAKPSLPFYPDDWMNDLGLRGCAPASRGIWADMLCLMHQGVPYGFLTDRAGPLSMPFVASRTGVTARQLAIAIAELEEHNVFSRDEGGVIFSRRMVRDEHRRIVRGQGGFSSANNPAVPRSKGILKGILSSAPSDPPFDPEEVKEKETTSQNLKKLQDSVNGKAFDPIPGWTRFKLAYPSHRINEYTDLQLWISIVDSEEIQELIIARVKERKQGAEWRKEHGKFVPKACNFLGERQFGVASEPTNLAPEATNLSPEMQKKAKDLGVKF